MSFELAHTIIEHPDKSAVQQLFLLHGILGSSRNWRSFAQEFVRRNPEWRVVLVDLPAHGGSRSAPEPFHLPSCSDHLVNLAASIGRPRALIGHSFGGKVAVQTASAFGPDPLAVIVLDCPLLALEGETRSTSEIAKVVAEIDQVPQPLERRSTVTDSFEAAGFSPSLAGWMATNLIRNPAGEGYVWHFNKKAIVDLLADYWGRDYHAYLADPGADREFLLVKAENSDRFGPVELTRSEALSSQGLVQWTTLPKSGHWLHIDNPDGLLDVLREFLSGLY